jgi:uncharacterized protein
MMPPKTWYADGLRFECQSCGDCCRNHGEYCYVFLTGRDVVAIAEHLGISQDQLIEKHCERVGDELSLRTDLPDCPFLKDGECVVYPVRPKQCETWPFWTDNLTSYTWRGPVSRCCPGIGRGRRYSKDEIETIARERDRWYSKD